MQFIQGIRLFVGLFEKRPALGAEMSRPGPVPPDTEPARTAHGSPAQWSGLGGAASYPERFGSFSHNEIVSKRTKWLSTPAHPLTAMKAERGMGKCKPQGMKEKEGKSQPPQAEPLPAVPSREEVRVESGTRWSGSKGSRWERTERPGEAASEQSFRVS